MRERIGFGKLMDKMTFGGEIIGKDLILDELGFVVGLNMKITDRNGKDFTFTLPEDTVIVMSDGHDEE